MVNVHNAPQRMLAQQKSFLSKLNHKVSSLKNPAGLVASDFTFGEHYEKLWGDLTSKAIELMQEQPTRLDLHDLDASRLYMTYTSRFPTSIVSMRTTVCIAWNSAWHLAVVNDHLPVL